VGGAAALDAAGAVSSPARLSFPPPRITAVLQDCASDAGCAPLGTFIVRGVNLGNAARPAAGANATDAAATARFHRFLQGFEFVQYAVLPVMDPADCAARGASGALANASCALHTAVNCSYVTPHAAIACEVDPAGWGTGFSVRVVVGGQASAWSDPALDYPAPSLQSIATVWVAGAKAGAPQSAAALPNGGSLLRVRGAGLAPLSQLVLFVGGVPVRPLSEDFGALARANASAAPPLPLPDGSLASPAQPRAAPAHVLLVCAPPGVGTVSVEAWVGSRSSAKVPLAYAAGKFGKPIGARAGHSLLRKRAFPARLRVVLCQHFNKQRVRRWRLFRRSVRRRRKWHRVAAAKLADPVALGPAAHAFAAVPLPHRRGAGPAEHQHWELRASRCHVERIPRALRRGPYVERPRCPCHCGFSAHALRALVPAFL
jgi:hypothetical protein